MAGLAVGIGGFARARGHRPAASLQHPARRGAAGPRGRPRARGRERLWSGGRPREAALAAVGGCQPCAATHERGGEEEEGEREEGDAEEGREVGDVVPLLLHELLHVVAEVVGLLHAIREHLVEFVEARIEVRGRLARCVDRLHLSLIHI